MLLSLFSIGVLLTITAVGLVIWGRPPFRRIGIIVGIALSIAFVGFALLQFVVFQHATTIAHRLGLSQEFVTLLGTASFTLVVSLFVYSFWFSRATRLYARTGLTAMVLATMGVIAILGTNQRVSQQGDALQCYIIEASGVIWRDVQFSGIDPRSGRSCEPAEAYLVPILDRLDERLRSGRPLVAFDPKGYFFSTIGDPIVWYARLADGSFVFYDAPGYDPLTGTVLLPVSSEVVSEFQKQEGRQAQQSFELKTLAEEQLVIDQMEAEALAVEAELDAEMQRERRRIDDMRLLVLGPVSEAEPAPLAFALQAATDSDLDKSAVRTLPGLLAKRTAHSSRVIEQLFRNEFFVQGYGERALSGDLSPLRETGALDRVERIVVGLVHVECNPNPLDGELTNCGVSIDFATIGPGGEIIGRGQVSEIGPGLTPETATARAVELVALRHSAEIL